MQGDKILCLKSFPIKDEKGERSDLELERPPPRFCNPDIIDSQTLHSVGKFALPLGNTYLDFARCTMVHPGAAAAAAQRWLSWKMVAGPSSSPTNSKIPTFMLRLIPARILALEVRPNLLFEDIEEMQIFSSPEIFCGFSATAAHPEKLSDQKDSSQW